MFYVMRNNIFIWHQLWFSIFLWTDLYDWVSSSCYFLLVSTLLQLLWAIDTRYILKWISAYNNINDNNTFKLDELQNVGGKQGLCEIYVYIYRWMI